jgi:hypothetical protein
MTLLRTPESFVVLNGSAQDVNLVERLRSFPILKLAVERYRVQRMRESASVADGNSVYTIGKLFVILISPPAFPHVAAQEGEAMREAKASLPGPLSSIVSDIVLSDLLDDGRSFIVVPRGKVLSSNRLLFAYQRKRVKPVVLQWLRGVSMSADGPSEAAVNEFAASLVTLTNITFLPEAIVRTAHRSLTRLHSGVFMPRFCFMHGDLWRGNIIFAPDNSVKIIDWRGFKQCGYGLFDLMRFAHSLNLSASETSAEIVAHSEALCISREDVASTLLAGCGHIARNLGEFPLDRFVEMTVGLWEFYERSSRKQAQDGFS